MFLYLSLFAIYWMTIFSELADVHMTTFPRFIAINLSLPNQNQNCAKLSKIRIAIL